MEYYLMYHIDQDGNDGIVLTKRNDLYEMDNYIASNFKTGNDAYNYFKDDISEFCLDRKDKIIKENKRNNHNRLGAISLFAKYENAYGTRIIKMPIIYGNDCKLLSNDNCITKIKEKLNDINVLKKILISKEYLLSYNERDTLSNYLKLHKNYDKEKFKNHFLSRLEKMNEQKKYFFFRCLMNLCKLNILEIKTKVGNIKLGNEIPTNTFLEKDKIKKNIKLESYLDDDFFTNLIEQEDYDTLHKYYDIETIEKYSNIRGNK